MTKVVWGCFQWVGFHMIQDWLNKGEHIIGIDTVDTEQKEMLEMFVGRNANFSRWESIEASFSRDAGTGIEAVFAFEDQQYIPPLDALIEIPASSYYRVNLSHLTSKKEPWITIDLPHVYGPWMTTETRSITEQSVYISDVIEGINTLLQANQNETHIKLGMESDLERNNKGITPIVSHEKGMQLLQDHQRRFPTYY